MRRSLFAVVIMLSASGALAAGPNSTAVTTDTGAMMDAAKAAVLTSEGVLAAETNVWRTVWNMPDGTPVTTSAMMDAAKLAVLMPEGAVSFADARALWADTEVPSMGVNRRPLGLSSD